MSPRVEKALFMVWGWSAAPLVLGALGAAFLTNVWFGVGLFALTAFWILNMGATTCTRCGSYGTGRCGVQSKLVPLIWKRKTTPVSLRRIRGQRLLDYAMMAACMAAFVPFPFALPIVVAWLLLGWFVVYRPKRNHGLLSRLDASTRRTALSLPVLPPS